MFVNLLLSKTDEKVTLDGYKIISQSKISITGDIRIYVLDIDSSDYLMFKLKYGDNVWER